MGSSSAPTPPKPPSYDYQQGVDEQMKYAPQLAQSEMNQMQQYAPQEAQLLASYYANAAPSIANTNEAILNKVNPQFNPIYNQYANAVSGDLKQGTAMSPQLSNQVTQQIRGAQAARGNIMGSAPVSAEGTMSAQAGQQLYQQRLGNVDAFMRTPTPESQFGSLLGAGSLPVAMGGMQATSLPIGNLYNPAIGGDIAQSNYGSNLNQWASQYNPSKGATSGANPWMGALSGAASGASAGMAGGPYGAAIGAVAGGLYGGLNTAYGSGSSTLGGLGNLSAMGGNMMNSSTMGNMFAPQYTGYGGGMPSVNTGWTQGGGAGAAASPESV